MNPADPSQLPETQTQASLAPQAKRRRGFATLSPERRQAIARKGGRMAHASGRAHQFTTDEARAAGKKGGMSVSRDQDHMSKIGRRGAQAREQRASLRSAAATRPLPAAPSGGAAYPAYPIYPWNPLNPPRSPSDGKRSRP